MTVADTLQLSRDAHDRYRENLPRRVGNGSGGTVAVPGDAELAGEALADACRYRAEAHVLDPEQVDPAWGDEAATHDHVALLDFYVEQLAREPDAVKDATGDVGGVIADAQQVLDPVELPPIHLQTPGLIPDTVTIT